MLSLVVNGERREFTQHLSCAQLIEELGLTGKRVALECNGEIVPRGQHAARTLGEGDRVEIVVAVGGG
jgi:sulfur carrier protein